MTKTNAFLDTNFLCTYALLGALSSLCLHAHLAFALDTKPATPHVTVNSEQAGTVYTPDYFKQYAPRTALDMVGHIPGFSIHGGSGGKRGLGQGGANVLINGERISGKTSARDQLSRINAANVVSIKIVEGTTLDIPGLSGQVANVITKSSKISGSWAWTPSWRDGLEADILNGKLTLSGKRERLEWSITAKNTSFRQGHRGPKRLLNARQALFEYRFEDAQYYGDNPGIAIDLGWKPKEGHTANLDIKANQNTFNLREFSHHTPTRPRGNDNQTLFRNSAHGVNGSLSADYQFPFLMKDKNAKLKLIAYGEISHSPSVSIFDTFAPASGLLSWSRFGRIRNSGEAIFRTEYSWKTATNRDWQIGNEVAYNFLDTQSALARRSGDNTYRPVALPGSTSRVEETRFETTLTHSRKLGAKLDLQASLGAEYSEISQTTGLSRAFFRPKGFVSLSWKPSGRLTLTPKISREVGQLNFGDFVSSVNLRNNLGSAGNINLVPQQNWAYDLRIEQKIRANSQIKIFTYYDRISDLVDRIPIGDTGDAVGNIATAEQYGISLSSTLKGKDFGYEGLELNLGLSLQASSVLDPVEGFLRPLNNQNKTVGNASLRYDIPKTDWAFGGAIFSFDNTRAYRLSTISLRSNSLPFASLYLEHKDLFGLKIRASALNVLKSRDEFEQVYFTARRDIGRLDYRELSSRKSGISYSLNLSGTF